MIFNEHSDVEGHALFPPSQSAWLRYDDDKIINKFQSQYRSLIGTEIHEFAASQIELGHRISGVKKLEDSVENYIYTKYKHLDNLAYGLVLLQHLNYLPDIVYETVKHYINDGVSFKMKPEQKLVYSDFFFGTADTISYRNDRLQIHDLKTGDHPAHMEQLEVYAALFCLEYKAKPTEIELRLYQSDDILIANPNFEDILPIMDRIVAINSFVSKIEKGEQR